MNDPKTISISAKCRDNCYMSVMDANKQEIASQNDYVPSFMPNGGSGYLEIEIDIEEGRILDWTNPIGDDEFNDLLKDAGKKVPKTVSISAFCRDMFDMSVMNKNGDCIGGYDGYVPSFIPGSYGDNVDLEIDIETGEILNWTNPIGDPEFDDILEGGDEDSEDDEDDEEGDKYEDDDGSDY